MQPTGGSVRDRRRGTGMGSSDTKAVEQSYRALVIEELVKANPCSGALVSHHIPPLDDVAHRGEQAVDVLGEGPRHPLVVWLEVEAAPVAVVVRIGEGEDHRLVEEQVVAPD